jgi:hypothetical protein
MEAHAFHARRDESRGLVLVLVGPCGSACLACVVHGNRQLETDGDGSGGLRFWLARMVRSIVMRVVGGMEIRYSVLRRDVSLAQDGGVVEGDSMLCLGLRNWVLSGKARFFT